MTTKKLQKNDRIYLQRLGEKIRKIILVDLGYSSLDAFALEHHDLIAKPTLYQVCDGKRDMKLSTLRSLASALNISLDALIRIN